MIQGINLINKLMAKNTNFGGGPDIAKKIARNLTNECSHCKVCYYPFTCTQKGVPKRNGHTLIDTLDKTTKTLDIRSNAMYPANVLSNLTRNPFYFDGVRCGSMEGFLQSLKIPDKNLQKEMCTKFGGMAKKLGNQSNEWKKTQTLWWQGKAYQRDSEDYQELIKRAYKEQFCQSSLFRKALKCSKDYTLTHTLGKTDTTDTILSREEFIKMLGELKKIL